MNDQDKLIYDAWRDSESYQVPVTEEGQKLADRRYRSFSTGWKYAKFHSEHGTVYMKDYIDDALHSMDMPSSDAVQIGTMASEEAPDVDTISPVRGFGGYPR